MAKIPVNVDNLKTEFAPLDENISYRVILRAARINEQPDKNGNDYLTGIKLEVTEPEEWRGRNIFVNYVALPKEITSDMTLSQRRAAEETGVQFARMVACLQIPHDDEGIDTDEMIGCEGEVMVRTEEYQGRKSSRVQEWLLP